MRVRPPNDPTIKLGPTLAPGFSSFWKWAIVSRARACIFFLVLSLSPFWPSEGKRRKTPINHFLSLVETRSHVIFSQKVFWGLNCSWSMLCVLFPGNRSWSECFLLGTYSARFLFKSLSQSAAPFTGEWQLTVSGYLSPVRVDRGDGMYPIHLSHLGEIAKF